MHSLENASGMRFPDGRCRKKQERERERERENERAGALVREKERKRERMTNAEDRYIQQIFLTWRKLVY